MKAAEEMKREQKEVKLRMILQDYHRRNDYELQQAVNDILALDALPPAEGAEEIAQCCPVCGGNGLVPNGFYNQTSGQWTSCSTLPGTCRTCNGTGVILPSYLHAQKTADKMVSERLNNAPKNCPKAAQCAHVEGGMKCPPNIICPI